MSGSARSPSTSRRLRFRRWRSIGQARKAAMSFGLTTVELPGIDAKAVQERLRERERILVQAFVDNARAPHIRGLSVSPNVHATPADLTRFVDALVAAVGA